MGNKPKRLGEMLVEANLITESQLRGALGQQKKWGGRLGANLVKLGNISEESLVRFLASQTGVNEMDISRVTILPRILKLVPQKVAEKFSLLPIAMKDKKTLIVACADPTDLSSLDHVSFITGLNVEPNLATHSAIKKGIAKFYGSDGPALAVDREIKMSTGKKEPKLVELSTMDEHGGKQAADDPDLIIFGSQSHKDSASPNNQDPDGTFDRLQYPPPAQDNSSSFSDDFSHDDQEFTLDFSPDWAAKTGSAPKPAPARAAPKKKFTFEQKTRAMFNVLVRKGLVSQKEIKDELMRLMHSGKL